MFVKISVSGGEDSIFTIGWQMPARHCKLQIFYVNRLRVGRILCFDRSFPVSMCFWLTPGMFVKISVSGGENSIFAIGWQMPARHCKLQIFYVNMLRVGRILCFDRSFPPSFHPSCPHSPLLIISLRLSMCPLK